MNICGHWSAKFTSFDIEFKCSLKYDRSIIEEYIKNTDSITFFFNIL